MRALDRLISFIFSIIMLAVSVNLILVGVGVVDPQMIIDMLQEYVFVKEMIAANLFNTITIVGIVLFLASLKTTIFLSLFKTKDRAPILVKTPNGEVEIAQETITNTVRNVGASFENIKEVQAKMVKKRKGVVIYAMVLLYANSNLREITEEMQRQVKEVVKTTTGVDVLEVNIKVKNIYQKNKKASDSTEPAIAEQVVVPEKVENEDVEKATEEVIEKVETVESNEETSIVEEKQEDGMAEK